MPCIHLHYSPKLGIFNFLVFLWDSYTWDKHLHSLESGSQGPFDIIGRYIYNSCACCTGNLGEFPLSFLEARRHAGPETRSGLTFPEITVWLSPLGPTGPTFLATLHPYLLQPKIGGAVHKADQTHEKTIPTVASFASNLTLPKGLQTTSHLSQEMMARDQRPVMPMVEKRKTRASSWTKDCSHYFLLLANSFQNSLIATTPNPLKCFQVQSEVDLLVNWLFSVHLYDMCITSFSHLLQALLFCFPAKPSDIPPFPVFLLSFSSSFCSGTGCPSSQFSLWVIDSWGWYLRTLTAFSPQPHLHTSAPKRRQRGYGG